MQAGMMDSPLIVSSILRHAERVYGKNEIVSTLPEDGIWRTTYAEAASRARRLANALIRLGVRHQDRVATLAWNTHRHYELYYAVSGSGAIVHTVNPRLFPAQIAYIVNHAAGEVLFFDLAFLPLIEKLRPELAAVKHLVALAPREAMPQSALPLLCYEELIAGESESSIGRCCMRGWPLRSAIPPARRAIPRASSMGTVPPYSTLTLACPRTWSAFRAAVRCCRWYRCSTSTPGAFPIPPPWPARSWCFLAAHWTAPRLPVVH